MPFLGSVIRVDLWLRRETSASSVELLSRTFIRGREIFMRTAPDYIQFYPTMRCDRSCEFCFNRSMPYVPDMSLTDCRAMVDRLNAAGVKMIDVIGGEPTMHPDIIHIITEATSRGFYVNISSNGGNIEILDEISSADDKISVGISVNDRETLNHCASLIRKHKLVAKSVFSLEMDQSLVRDILTLRPKKFYLIYRDAADRQDGHALIPFHQFTEVVQHRFSVPDIGTVFCAGFLPDTTNCPELDHVRCPAGTTKLGIMPDGSAYPCNLFFGKREFLLGNILTDPFEVIWHHSSLTFFRSYSGNRCTQKSCELHARCHGGCPAQSHLLCGDIAAPDPRCSRDGRREADQIL
jgi:radical SAM protein with 4Fe4S-binding SPASM domain